MGQAFMMNLGNNLPQGPQIRRHRLTCTFLHNAWCHRLTICSQQALIDLSGCWASGCIMPSIPRFSTTSVLACKAAQCALSLESIQLIS